MSWEVIRNVKPTPPKAATVPPMGVSVVSRKMGARGGKVVRYINLGIGHKLAKELCLIGEQSGLRLALGGGKFAGKVALSVDQAADCFRAARAKDGGYVLTINASSAAGLFALEFAPFAVEAEMLPFERGKPPMACFPASAAMLGGAE